MISLTAPFAVPGLSGQDEDLIVWDQSSGQFELFLDATAAGLANSNEDVTGAHVDTSNDDPLLTTLGNYAVPGGNGDADDVFSLLGGGLTVIFDGDSAGVGAESLDAVSLAGPIVLLPPPTALVVHNLDRPGDVNDDGRVTALDALLVINYVARTADGDSPGGRTNLTDVNGDRQTSVSDALDVIHQLGGGAAESEPVSAMPSGVDPFDDDDDDDHLMTLLAQDAAGVNS